MGKKGHREFIAWDGEGIATTQPDHILDGAPIDMVWDGNRIQFGYEPQPQPYVLLANSKEERITNQEGLKTVDCFEFILETKRRYPHSIFVGFAFNYDVNQIVKDLPLEYLWELHETSETSIGSYYIKWLPRKSFYIKHGKTGRSATIYDVFPFFQTSFLKVCRNYLGENDPELALIQRGKDARSEFNWDELKEFIMPYNDTELSMLVRVMNILRRDFADVGVHPSLWHGPGAVANKVFKNEAVPISREIPEEVLDAAQFAYAGGRFEQFYMGRYSDTVYEYDIRSAYPEATTYLPNLCRGSWEFVESFEPGSFGVWNIFYQSNGHDSGPQPLFCRSGHGYIAYPTEVEGWYWTPEASLVPDSVQCGWVFRETSHDRPFAFVQGMYDQRRVFKEQGNSTERALKLILNSLYGKLAQTIGSKGGKPPSWHQLEYAGFITSYTRAKIYRAMMQNPDAIIATETDAVFSMVPLDLDIGVGLGQWELTEFSEVCYIQSGFYYAVTPDGDIVSKYRGMDRDPKTGQPKNLPYETVLEYLATMTARTDLEDPPPTYLTPTTSRFVGLGLGLRTSSVWRSWENNKSRLIRLDHDRYGPQKRRHVREDCASCSAGISMFERAHSLSIGGYSGKSHARSLPWRSITVGDTADISDEEWLEMNPEIKDIAGDIDKWQ